jgi:hypothetical protein
MFMFVGKLFLVPIFYCLYNKASALQLFLNSLLHVTLLDKKIQNFYNYF